GWSPTMGDFRRDGSDHWWFHVVGKGNKAARISVRDDYIQNYLARYRQHLQLPPLPSPHEKTPLISTLKGRAGLSDRHIRLLLQEVFDRSLARMAAEGWGDDEIDALRSASLHWLRHTSATFDAPYRDMKDLQADLRHNSLSTTQNVYYNTLDEQRAHSVKGLKPKRCQPRIRTRRRPCAAAGSSRPDAAGRGARPPCAPRCVRLRTSPSR